VKTTLEIPDAVFRRAKSKAAALGVPLRQFVTEAVEEKLKLAASREEKHWLKHFGRLKHLRKTHRQVYRRRFRDDRSGVLGLILDSNALSAEDAGLLTILHRSRQVSLPVIVLGEYRAGIAQSRHRSRYEAWLESFLADCTVLDISEETTRHYVTVVLASSGSVSGFPATISGSRALCRQYVLPVVTRDHHFDVVPNLQRLAC
jgi:tRNA(fMet)-specific endonuclease VapC